MKPSLELYIALRYLRFHRGQTFLSLITAISVAGVAVGAAALVIALSLNAGFRQDVRERIHSGSAHLTVMSTETTQFTAEAELLRRTREVAGVQTTAPVLYTPAMLTHEAFQSTGFTELHGIEPEMHARVIKGDAWDGSAFLALAQPTDSGRDGILVGVELARQLGVVEGDTVRVMVPQVTLSPLSPIPRSRLFEVVGTYASEHFQQDSQRAYVNLEAAGRLLRATGQASWLEVRLDRLGDLEQVKSRLQDSLNYPWIVVDLIEQNAGILQALNMERVLLFLAIVLIVIVAALNIVSTLILMVTDKVREIGTLTAMGARGRSIASVFILQGLTIGVVGTVLGLALGSGLAFALNRFELIKLDPEVYFLTHLPFVVQPMDLLIVGVSAVMVSLLATIYPALRAASLDPVEALRFE